MPFFFRPTSRMERGYSVAAIATELGAIAGLLLGILLGSMIITLFSSVLSDDVAYSLLSLSIFLGWLAGGTLGCDITLHRLHFPRFRKTALWTLGLMGALLAGILFLAAIAPHLDTAWLIFLFPAFLGAAARFLAIQ